MKGMHGCSSFTSLGLVPGDGSRSESDDGGVGCGMLYAARRELAVVMKEEKVRMR